MTSPPLQTVLLTVNQNEPFSLKHCLSGYVITVTGIVTNTLGPKLVKRSMVFMSAWMCGINMWFLRWCVPMWELFPVVIAPCLISTRLTLLLNLGVCC